MRTRGCFKQSLPDKPLITVITAVLNNAQEMEKSIVNILNQPYGNIEYIIIDGGSTDDTVDIINKYERKIDYWISEPDSGVYDAWNKGVRLATGKYIAFIGAGDSYVDHGLENLVACTLANPEADLISSKMAIIRDGAIQRVLGRSWQWKKFRRYMNTGTEGSLHSIRLFEKFGEFDPSYRIAGDYEFLLRARDALKTAYVDMVTVRVAAGGLSQTNYRVFHEVESAKIRHKAVPALIARIDRYIAYCKLWFRIKIIG